ncbi:type II toxin-antitoxin system RelE/ParE family toxin [Kineosporia sp. J2-2]|uniref:Type II toxin-antitoxin system RelE/ParE family toxin n=1 Tax=Kineosporia corallincola TaxID=2835133 RepID=A0ABS5THI3_9ACTN|nr:type II toxin-antitoxin system RelE/ParE family toxin [Kineosporia corallincola]MBT0769059.1 type II toxin-antitoxin system RelE/ParE family toxin [Kineosporia corallincola]
MTYKIVLAASAKRDLAKLPEKVLPAVLEFIAGPLSQEPHRVGKPLMNDLHGLRSARRGTFRIVYHVGEALIEVHVVRVRHRRDAYRSG